jgi:hypothetical protein
MSELLIFARNNTQTDPETDRRGCYKRGMPVVVAEDGHTWGRDESKQVWIAEGRDPALWPGQGKFVLLKIPGVPSDKARALIASQDEDDAGVQSADTQLIAFRRRRWVLRLDDLPVGVRNTLVVDGEYTADTAAKRQAVRDRLKRIRDNAQFVGLDGAL